MSLYALLKSKGRNGFGYGSSATDVAEGLDLSQKKILLTGCNSGIGLETLRVLGNRGAHFVAAARSVDKAQQALDQTGVTGTAIACELSEPASVQACVEAIRSQGHKLDAIICNAGIMALPKLKQSHGLELQFLTNHIGHFILVTGVLSQLADDGRVVIVSSSAHKGAPSQGIQFDNLDGSHGYSPFRAYGQSKLANILFAKQLAKRFAGTAKTANALHPGVIKTNLGRHMNPVATVALSIAGPLMMKSIPQGAATQVFLAAHPLAAKYNGEYFSDCNPAETSALARDEKLAEQLWQHSEKLVATLLPA